MRYFTSDWHINCAHVLEKFNRPFKSVDDMNRRFIEGCNQRCNFPDVNAVKKCTVYHLGDFLGYGNDHGYELNRVKSDVYTQKILADFILLEGNHDVTNGVRCHGKCMTIDLGRYTNVTMSHYPSTDGRCVDLYRPHNIHLCGHVHNLWKYMYDEKNDVLNINVGVDVWKYVPVSERTLERYIDKLCVELHYVPFI